MYFYFYRIKIIVVCTTVKKRRFGVEDHSFTGLSNFTGLV